MKSKLPEDLIQDLKDSIIIEEEDQVTLDEDMPEVTLVIIDEDENE